jgi:hypothetical protein
VALRITDWTMKNALPSAFFVTCDRQPSLAHGEYVQIFT